MKKLFLLMVLTSLVIGSLFAGGTRCKAMGDVSSLIDSKNISTYPQRLINYSSCLWLVQTDKEDVYGNVTTSHSSGVRYMIKENYAIQINAAKGENKGTANWDYNYQSLTAYNRLNVVLATKMAGFDLGFKVKLFSNSTYDKEKTIVDSTTTNNTELDLKIRYYDFGFGLTKDLDSNKFFDMSLDFGIGSWDGSYTVNDSDYFEYGQYENDGWSNLKFNGRYYVKGETVDYTSYVGYGFNSKKQTRPFNEDLTGKYEDSDWNILGGIGIHLKPVKGVKVYNDIELSYRKVNDNYDDNDSNNDNETIETDSYRSLLPTYKVGAELCHKFNEDKFFELIKFRGGFNRSFTKHSYTYEDYNSEGEGFMRSYDNEIKMTYGVAIHKHNFSLEFTGTTADVFTLQGTYFFK
ncbi:MAG: hypothetical protein K8S23_14590 [Candidatus Cloacimonetes bacterium]|nr:hypothetical protein [Candidatus Cloacimonadota bacterium]